jgi:hypothetical protein
MDLIGLFATLALLAVTAWYAKTTSVMAKTAKEAAEASARATGAAERSAVAARDAATVAQSQISPEFRGRIIPAADQDDEGLTTGHAVCLHIKSIGDAVVVQEVRIVRAFGPSSRLSDSDRPQLVDERLEPFDDESALPKRLHLHETVLLTHPAMNDEEHLLERFILNIRYTFSEDGQAGGTRRLVVSPDSNW